MAKPGKSLDIETLWKLERIGGVSIAPDGTRAVCSVASYSMDDNKSQASLWLLGEDGREPRRLTACGDKDGAAAWSPRGDAIAFLAKREQEGKKDDSAQLYLIAPDGGEARRLSEYGPGIDAFKWFADGKRIAFVAWVWPGEHGAKGQNKRHKAWKERKETGYATGEAQYRHWDRNLPMDRVAHLHVLDVASGRVTDLFEGTPYELHRMEPDAHTFDIAPDGRHIVFCFDPADEKRNGNCKALAEVNLKSGKIGVLARDAAWDFEAPRYGPDGTRIAFLASHLGHTHTAPANLSMLRRGGKWQVLSDAWDHAVNAPLRWAADGSALYFTAEDQARCHLYRYALESHSAAVVAEGGWVQSFDVAGDVLAVVADAIDHPARVTMQRDSQAPRRVERFNDELMAGLRFGPHESRTVTGAQGDPVQMWLVYPPGFDARRKYPVLHNIHGGPHAAAGDTFHYRWNVHALAAQGYVVACVNYHGSSGFGHAFLDSITHRWGELELQDVEAATDWLRKQAWADRKRFFAAGGSYGGYMVAWMNGHLKADRYRAYVCHAGCYDWRAMFAGDAYSWFSKELGADYWKDGARIDAQSPIGHAAHFTTPTLVIHGALDYRVPDAQGLAYYNTLKEQGIDARLLWFPDENHWILKPRNSKQWYGEFFAWLARHDVPGTRRLAKA